MLLDEPYIFFVSIDFFSFRFLSLFFCFFRFAFHFCLLISGRCLYIRGWVRFSRLHNRCRPLIFKILVSREGAFVNPNVLIFHFTFHVLFASFANFESL